MPKIEMYDNFVLDASSFRRTGDGYMVATPRVARTGIQDYLGREMGRPDLDKVRVYRAPSEVFSPDSMRSLAFKPVTLDHPPVPVTDKNWKKYSSGTTGGEVARDGDFIRVPMMMADAATIKAVEDGEKVELSCGYGTEIDWTPGVVPDGEPNAGEAYDARQTAIRYNHVACVRRARGGDKLRVGDADTKVCPECEARMPKNAKKCPECGYEMVSDSHHNEGDYPMPKLITVDAVNVELTTDTSAQIVLRALESRDAKIAEFEKKKKEQEDALAAATADAATQKALVATKDTEIATLKAAVVAAAPTPAQLDALNVERNASIERGRKIMGDKLVVDGKSTGDIRRQVVDSMLGETSRGWDDKTISTSFDTLVAAFGDKGPAPTGRTPVPGVTDVSFAFSRPGIRTGGQDALDAAYAEHDKMLRAGRTRAA